MKRTYFLAIEGEPGSYSAYVPELPAILVTGQSVDELTGRAREAIRWYWESVRAELSQTSYPLKRRELLGSPERHRLKPVLHGLRLE